MGTYTLILTGSISGGVSISVKFSLTIFDSCASSSINLNLISDKEYDVWSNTPLAIANLDWTVTPSYCPTITYSLYDQGTLNLAPSIFSKNGGVY